MSEKARASLSAFAFLLACFLSLKSEVVYRFIDPARAFKVNLEGKLETAAKAPVRVSFVALRDEGTPIHPRPIHPQEESKLQADWRPGANSTEIYFSADELGAISGLEGKAASGPKESIQLTGAKLWALGDFKAEDAGSGRGGALRLNRIQSAARDAGGAVVSKQRAIHAAYVIVLLVALALFLIYLPSLAAVLNAWISRLSSMEPASDVLFAFWVAVLLVAVIYPGFFAFTSFPFLTSGRELQDPYVSQWVMYPSHEVLRTEVLGRFNWLWSSLRAGGAPLLGNEVQAAPLFPLTWALLPLPMHLFPNALVIARLVLLTMGSVLVGLRVLRMSRSSAALFALVFALGMAMARWLNHPMQNGVLAAVWCIYFADGVIRDRSRWAFPGLVLGLFALVNCGFPESTSVGGLLFLFVVLPDWISAFRSDRHQARVALAKGIGAGVLALGLASPQIFALVEFVKEAGPKFRGVNGLAQMGGLEALLRWTLPWQSSPPVAPTYFVLGGAASYLFLRGILLLRERPFRWPEWAALTCLAFYVLKVFTIWPRFNLWVGSLPVLRDCWFTVYFFPLLTWPLAFLIARGAEGLGRTKAWRTLVCFALIAFAGAGVGAGSGLAELVWNREAGAVLLISIVLGLAIFRLERQDRIRSGRLSGLAFLIALADLLLFMPRGFMPPPWPKTSEFGWESGGKALNALYERKGLSKADFRVQDLSGNLASFGLATPDDGAMAILTARMRAWRSSLFTLEKDDFLFLHEGRFPYSWSVIGTRFLPAASREEAEARARAKDCPGCQVVEADANGPFFVELPHVLGRASIPERCRVAKDSAESLSILTDPAQGGALVVETESEAEREACLSWKAVARGVGIESDEGSRVRLRKVQGPAWVSLADSFYPGWRAVDLLSGALLEIRAGNHGFRAVYLPEAREYQVEFRYQPAWLKWAVAATLASAAGLCLSFVLLGRKRMPVPLK